MAIKRGNKKRLQTGSGYEKLLKLLPYIWTAIGPAVGELGKKGVSALVDKIQGKGYISSRMKDKLSKEIMDGQGFKLPGQGFKLPGQGNNISLNTLEPVMSTQGLKTKKKIEI